MRPPKDTPTPLNLWVLDRVFGGVSGPDEVPNRIDPPSVPHVRRCWRAGLVEVDVPAGIIRLTAAGRAALGRRS